MRVAVPWSRGELTVIGERSKLTSGHCLELGNLFAVYL